MPNGPGAAAVLAAGIGSLALGVFAFAGDASPPIGRAFNIWNPTGPLSGVINIYFFYICFLKSTNIFWHNFWFFNVFFTCSWHIFSTFFNIFKQFSCSFQFASTFSTNHINRFV